MERNTLIERYFGYGRSQKEILTCLAQTHGVITSQRHLRRLLKNLGLRRRSRETSSSLLKVAEFIEDKLETSDQLHGYRSMHLTCIQSGLIVSQKTVSALQN